MLETTRGGESLRERGVGGLHTRCVGRDEVGVGTSLWERFVKKCAWASVRELVVLVSIAMWSAVASAHASSWALGAEPEAGSSGASSPRPRARASGSPSSGAIKRPVIDLEQMARDRRPGQVMPGDVSPDVPVTAPTSAAQVAVQPETAIAQTGAKTLRSAPLVPGAQALQTAPTAAVSVDDFARPAPPSEAATTGVASGIENDPAPIASLQPARVRVAAVTSTNAQWRAPVGGWQALSVGQESQARVDVRAGLDADVVMVVDDVVELRVERLGRVSIERGVESDGRSCVLVTLGRGRVEVRPVNASTPTPESASSYLARVRTPDRSIGVRQGAVLEYDAFTGTRVRVLSGGQ